MREFKFRAWRVSEKKMLQDIYTPKVHLTWDNPVMQYTGLKDKNRMDIYEDDILINPKGELGIVKWYNAGFHLECKRPNNQTFFILLDLGFLANKTIIGNIHENPELFKP